MNTVSRRHTTRSPAAFDNRASRSRSRLAHPYFSLAALGVVLPSQAEGRCPTVRRHYKRRQSHAELALGVGEQDLPVRQLGPADLKPGRATFFDTQYTE